MRGSYSLLVEGDFGGLEGLEALVVGRLPLGAVELIISDVEGVALGKLGRALEGSGGLHF